MTERDEAVTPAGTGGILARKDGATIAYNRLPGKNPGVMFLHGFQSDMSGGKALAVEEFCLNRGQAFLRLDVTGHGQSSGAFVEGGIGQWAGDVVSALDALTEGPQVLVGSSMGGWLMLLAALERRDRVVGLLGLAAAPDFTEDLIFETLTPEQKRSLLIQGQIELEDCDSPRPYIVSRTLVEEGRQNLLLQGPINLTCPVRLIHGQQDPDVPWDRALRLQDHLLSADVEVTLVKSAGHRLNEPADLARMLRTLEELLTTVGG